MGTLGQNGGTVYKARLWGHIPLHRPYMGLIYGTSNKSVPEISLDASGQLRMNLDPAVNK